MGFPRYGPSESLLFQRDHGSSPAAAGYGYIDDGSTVHATTLLPGDYVKKGSVVVSLENPDFITLQQTYLDAHAQTEYLEAEYKGNSV